MGHDVDFHDGGIATFREARANGLNAATLHAPAALAATYDVELFDALPAATEFVQIDATGKLFTSVGASGTLDEAYDSGGAGAGRIIVADNGAVEIQGAGGLLVTTGQVEISGAGGFQLSHTDPFINLETTGAGDFNWRIRATAGDLFDIQRGDQDADVSDDTFESLFTMDGVNRFIGINQPTPLTDLHILGAAAKAASLRIQAVATEDATLQFYENALSRFEIGYDDSAGGLVVARADFTDTAPPIFIEDGTDLVHIGSSATLSAVLGISKPDATVRTAQVYITDASGGATNLFVHKTSTSASDSSVAIFENDRVNTTVPAVKIEQAGDGVGLNIVSNAPDGFPALNVLMTGAEAAAFFSRATVSSGGPVVEIQDDIGAVNGALLIDQNGNREGINIDSEATGFPLISLAPINGNSRGDINFSTARTGDPSSPSEGDFWYNSTTNVFKYHDGTGVKTITAS